MKILRLLAPALCLGLSACKDVALSVSCPPSIEPSVVVGVLDAATGNSAAPEATGSWTTASGLSDSLRHQSGEGFSQLVAYGPPGMYVVRVQRPGHAEWVQSNLWVAQGECGPATVHVTATPQPVQQ